MTRARLIHFHPGSAAGRVRQLESAGLAVEYAEIPDSAEMRRLAERTPDIYLIDLERRPSHGREIGLWLRRTRTTRPIPLLFVGGALAKVERVRKLLPDASFCTWEEVASAVTETLADPPANPFVPASQMAGYSGTPLPKKLGIKDGSLVALIDPPAGFEKTLGQLPPRARLVLGQDPDADLTIWFCLAQADLDARIGEVRERLSDRERLWIAWPKRSSGLASDLGQAGVRAAGGSITLFQRGIRSAASPLLAVSVQFLVAMAVQFHGRRRAVFRGHQQAGRIARNLVRLTACSIPPEAAAIPDHD